MSEVESNGECVIRGVAAAPGVAVAPAVVLERADTAYPQRYVLPDACDEEWARFSLAVLDAQDAFRSLYARLEPGRPEAAVLEAYALMAGDALLADEVEREIRAHLRGAEWAVMVAVGTLGARLLETDDPYLRERSQDITFVGQRLVRSLLCAAREGAERESFRVVEPAIVVARELSPADAAAMSMMPVRGFVTEVGSRTSHTAILARALGIPAVVGVGEACKSILPGARVLIDGGRGAVTLDPTEASIMAASRRLERSSELRERLSANRDESGRTRDGAPIGLLANIEFAHDVEEARARGAEGVGLYRTEFLFADARTRPTEDAQFDAFRRVVEAMEGRPVTLRTFDLGGDKFGSAFDVPPELNPMLGVRGVRLQLREPDVLSAHLRAMVRASAFGPVRILVPLLTTLDELDRVRRLLDQAKRDVLVRGQHVDGKISLGAMVEVPAMAMMAPRLAREVDFLSLGTNDLVQHTLAVDRGNRTLAHLSSVYHPGVLRLIRHVAEAAADAGCPLSVCGEMAGEPLGALTLVGLGIDTLSMDPGAIAVVKEALSRVTKGELVDAATRALDARTSADVEGLLDAAFGERLLDLTDASVVTPRGLRAT